MYVEGCGVYECKAKGVFRNRKVKPLVGDRVEIQVIDEAEHKGNMEEILPRTSELIRPAVANVDQAMVIFAAAKPKPNLSLLDRFLSRSLHQFSGSNGKCTDLAFCCCCSYNIIFHLSLLLFYSAVFSGRWQIT